MAKDGARDWIVGLVIVAVGVLLLLDTTGTYDVGMVFRFFPSVLIALGLYGVIRRGFRNVFGPLFLVAFGAAWQAVALDYLSWGEVWQFWPVVVVLIGLSILLDRSDARVTVGPRVVAEQSGEEFSVVSILSDATRRVRGPFVRDGDAVAVLGSARVDLRELETTHPVRLDVVSILGDVEVVVPEGWRVELEITEVLGDVTDDRRSRGEGDLRLVLSGVALLGDVTIRD